MRNVTVRQMQIFVEAAERLSLARVAELLHLTPSAVSFQIKQIEAQAGFALFERVGRKVVLTDAGQLLLGYARLVLRSLADADRALADLKGLSGGRIRLGLVSTSKYVVPHIIARFRLAYPDVTIVLTEGNRSSVLQLLTRGVIDLAIMGQPPADADVQADRFAPHPSIIIASITHKMRSAASLTRFDLASEPFILREEGSGTRALADAFFRIAGFQPRVTMETSSNEMIKQAVIAGMGIALISHHTVTLELSLGLVVALPVEGFPLERSWFVVSRRTLPLLPIQLRLQRFLIEEGSGIIEDIKRHHASLSSIPVAPAALSGINAKVHRL